MSLAPPVPMEYKWLIIVIMRFCVVAMNFLSTPKFYADDAGFEEEKQKNMEINFFFFKRQKKNDRNAFTACLGFWVYWKGAVGQTGERESQGRFAHTVLS